MSNRYVVGHGVSGEGDVVAALVGCVSRFYFAKAGKFQTAQCQQSCMTTLAIYLILDLDRSRQGLIMTDAIHQKMVGLRVMFQVK